ncbi:GNAT family N-acetyltransferase [Marinomonas agarivorans]|nr:GNAT family N-acetyltransferase [Marinomonas agarivorans]
MTSLVIRDAVMTDARTILTFIKDLATYEKAADQVIATEQDIADSLFGVGANIKGVICELDGVPIGFAIYFYNYSTWQGKKGIYLEDLYVTPESRGVGAGKALLKHLASQAITEGCGRFEWSVLDWNEPAIQFYESIGAKQKSEWLGYQLSGSALQDFALS